MRRIVVIGGTGFFGGLIVEHLRAGGLPTLSASRRGGDLQLDAENPQDLQQKLKLRDVVIDAAGPFHSRSVALIDAATRMGFDVIDISDSAVYARKVCEREQPIRAAGVRVLTACSSLSTVSAAIVRNSGVTEPRRVEARLVPAGRIVASPATTGALLASIRGRAAGGGILCDSVDAVTLPRIWPSLRQTAFIVDTKIPGLNALLVIAPWLAARWQRQGIRMVRRIGPRRGSMTYEIESAQGTIQQTFSGERGYLTAVIPAVLAARSIANGRFAGTGLVPNDRHVDPAELLRSLESEGVEIRRDRSV